MAFCSCLTPQPCWNFTVEELGIDDGPTYITCLPRHVLQQVLLHLDFKTRVVASSVCQEWNSVYKDLLEQPSFWDCCPRAWDLRRVLQDVKLGDCQLPSLHSMQQLLTGFIPRASPSLGLEVKLDWTDEAHLYNYLEPEKVQPMVCILSALGPHVASLTVTTPGDGDWSQLERVLADDLNELQELHLCCKSSSLTKPTVWISKTMKHLSLQYPADTPEFISLPSFQGAVAELQSLSLENAAVILEGVDIPETLMQLRGLRSLHAIESIYPCAELESLAILDALSYLEVNTDGVYYKFQDVPSSVMHKPGLTVVEVPSVPKQILPEENIEAFLQILAESLGDGGVVFM